MVYLVWQPLAVRLILYTMHKEIHSQEVQACSLNKLLNKGQT